MGKGITEDDLLFHDERTPEPTLAYLLSRMRHPDFPEPIGVFRAVDAPCYEDLMETQIAQARKARGAAIWPRSSTAARPGRWGEGRAEG